MSANESDILSGGIVPLPAPRRSSSNYDDIINRHSARTGLPPELVHAVIGQESSGNPSARSPKGAGGLMQLMPGTAQRFGVTDVNDPEQNIRGGTDYLKFLHDRYQGNVDLTLAAYNAGEGNVDKYHGIPPFRETQQYVPAVKARIGKPVRNTADILEGGLVDAPTTPQDPKIAEMNAMFAPQPKPTPSVAPGTETPPQAPQTPARAITGADVAWHLGADPSEFHTWSKRTQRRALKVVQDGVAEDERKKAAGQTVAPPPLAYQNQMRQRAGMPALDRTVNIDPSKAAIEIRPQPFTFGQPQPDRERMIDAELARLNAGVQDPRRMLRREAVAEHVDQQIAQQAKAAAQHQGDTHSRIADITASFLDAVDTALPLNTNIERGVVSAIGGTAKQLGRLNQYNPMPGASDLAEVARTTGRQIETGAEIQAERSTPTAQNLLNQGLPEGRAKSTFETILGTKPGASRTLQQAGGHAAVEIPKFMLGGEMVKALDLPSGALLPTLGGLSGAEEGLPGIVKGAGMGLLYHYGGALTGPYIGKVGNSLLWIGAPAAEANLIHGVPWDKAIAESLPMGLFAGTSTDRVMIHDGQGGTRPARLRDMRRIQRDPSLIVPPADVRVSRNEPPIDLPQGEGQYGLGDQVGRPLVPERKSTIAAQIEAITSRRGNRRAVVIPEGQKAPSKIPRGYTVTRTEAGLVIHPKEISPTDIQAIVSEGDTWRLLGHPNPDTPGPKKAVVAYAGRDALGVRSGDELMTSYSDPGSEAAAIEEMRQQFAPYKPQIEVGGSETAERAVSARSAPDPNLAQSQQKPNESGAPLPKPQQNAPDQKSAGDRFAALSNRDLETYIENAGKQGDRRLARMEARPKKGTPAETRQALPRRIERQRTRLDARVAEAQTELDRRRAGTDKAPSFDQWLQTEAGGRAGGIDPATLNPTERQELQARYDEQYYSRPHHSIRQKRQRGRYAPGIEPLPVEVAATVPEPDTIFPAVEPTGEKLFATEPIKGIPKAEPVAPAPVKAAAPVLLPPPKRTAPEAEPASKSYRPTEGEYVSWVNDEGKTRTGKVLKSYPSGAYRIRVSGRTDADSERNVRISGVEFQPHTPVARTVSHVVGRPKVDPATNTLAEAIRANGGLKPDRDGENAGEIAALRENGKGGIVNETSGLTANTMAERLAAEGYGTGEWSGLQHGNGIDSIKFLSAAIEDAGGSRKHYSNQYEPDFTKAEEDRYLGQMTADEKTQYEATEKFLASAKVKRLLNEVANGKATNETIATISEIGKRRGLSQDDIDWHIRFAGETSEATSERAREAPVEQTTTGDKGRDVSPSVREGEKSSVLLDQEFPGAVGASSPRRLLDYVPIKTLRLIADNNLSEWSHLSSNESRIKRAIDKANTDVGITERNDKGVLRNGMPEINKLVERFDGDWEKTLRVIKDYVADTATLPDNAPIERYTGKPSPQVPDLEADAAKSEYGSKNIGITRARADAAKARIQAKISGSQLHDITDFVSTLPDLAELGAYHIEAGARHFAKWSREYLKEFSEKDREIITPRLREIYDKAIEVSAKSKTIDRVQRRLAKAEGRKFPRRSEAPAPPATSIPAKSEASAESTGKSSALPPPVRHVPGERSFPKTAERSGFIGGTDRDYSVITDKDAIEAADRRIARIGMTQAQNELLRTDEPTKHDGAMGILLIQRLEKAGKLKEAVEVANDLSRKYTKAGQFVQSAAIITRLSPEGLLLKASREMKHGRTLPEETAQALTTKAHELSADEKTLAEIRRQHPYIFFDDGSVKPYRVARSEGSQTPLREKRDSAAPPVTRKRAVGRIGKLQDRLATMEQEARARMEARKAQGGIDTKKGQAGAVVNPFPDLADYAIIGAAKLARKGIDRATWLAEMATETKAGRRELRDIYRESYKLYEAERVKFRREARERSAQRETGRTDLTREDYNRIINEHLDAVTKARKDRTEIARIFRDLNASTGTKVIRTARDVWDLSRSLITSVDLSGGGRQAKTALVSHPQTFARGFVRQFKALSTKHYERMVSEMMTDADYKYASRFKLNLTSTATTRGEHEEVYQSELAHKLPWVKHSEQAYNTMLDTVRFGWWKTQLENMRRAGLDPENPDHKPMFEAQAALINNFTGRGGGKRLQQAAPLLNTAAFSARFWASRLRVLTLPLDPRMYGVGSPDHPAFSRATRVDAWKSLLGFYALTAGTLAIAKATGAQVNITDPDDPDWLKARWGKVHVDFSAGLQSHLRVAARLGKLLFLREFRPGKQRTGPADILAHYLRSKEAPNVALLHDLFVSDKKAVPNAGRGTGVTMRGTNIIGEPVYLTGEPGKGRMQRLRTSALAQRAIPIVLQDIMDAYQEGVSKKQGAAVVAASVFGEGVTTYQRKAKPGVPRPQRQAQASP